MGTAAAVQLNHHVVGRRVLAAILDIIIVGIGFGVMASLVGDFDRDGDGFGFELRGRGFLLTTAMAIAYYTLLEGLTGATLGKRVLGIRVVATDGGPCGLGRALVRNLLRIVDSAPGIYLLGLLVIAVTPQNQRIGDLAAGTLVVGATGPPAGTPEAETATRLRELGTLRDQGLITAEEYEERRKRILDRL